MASVSTPLALGSPCSFGAGIGSTLERKAFQIHQFPLHDLLKSDAVGPHLS